MYNPVFCSEILIRFEFTTNLLTKSMATTFDYTDGHIMPWSTEMKGPLYSVLPDHVRGSTPLYWLLMEYAHPQACTWLAFVSSISTQISLYQSGSQQEAADVETGYFKGGL